MYELKIRDYCFIAHSLNDKFFGPAQKLHGTTYIVDLILSSESLNDKNVIVDIGEATTMLKAVLDKYNYKNLDELEELADKLTTTEFMAERITEDIYNFIRKTKDSRSDIKTIKIILKENHIASASFTKEL